jgi:hypothetical protein
MAYSILMTPSVTLHGRTAKRTEYSLTPLKGQIPFIRVILHDLVTSKSPPYEFLEGNMHLENGKLHNHIQNKFG